LHNGCRQAEGEYREQAWGELSSWLTLQASHNNPHNNDPEGLAQETIAILVAKLPQLTIKPRTFLAYALQSLKNKNRDLNRRTSAAKRSEKDTLYLEEIEATSPGDETPHWEEKIETFEMEPNPPEKSMDTKEIHARIKAFFRTHLSSDLQIWVAEAHFLAGFSPAEIADQLGKYPHEIRLVKARVVRKLKNLPPEEKQKLLDILDIDLGDDKEAD